MFSLGNNELITVEKQKLGDKIKKVRMSNNISQRKLAKEICVSNSNLKYIEDGINAPSPSVYKKIIDITKPSSEIRQEMDSLYSKIRKSPPPEICDFIITYDDLYESIRKNSVALNKRQVEKLKKLLEEFAKENG